MPILNLFFEWSFLFIFSDNRHKRRNRLDVTWCLTMCAAQITITTIRSLWVTPKIDVPIWFLNYQKIRIDEKKSGNFFGTYLLRNHVASSLCARIRTPVCIMFYASSTTIEAFSIHFFTYIFCFLIIFKTTCLQYNNIYIFTNLI